MNIATIENRPQPTHTIRNISEKITDITRKVAVVALYIFIALLHVLEMPFSLLTLNIGRLKLNYTAIKIALFSLYTFSLPREHRLWSRFDFHHMSYGLLTMLLPGRFCDFGKWITSCSLINYDRLGVFGYKEEHFFSRNADNSYSLKPPHSKIINERDEEVAITTTDGTLEQISEVEFHDGKKIIRDFAYPADNFFVKYHRKIIQELFCFWRPAPYLNAVCTKKNQILEDVVKPHVDRLSADQMPIHIDFNLFKN